MNTSLNDRASFHYFLYYELIKREGKNNIIQNLNQNYSLKIFNQISINYFYFFNQSH